MNKIPLEDLKAGTIIEHPNHSGHFARVRKITLYRVVKPKGEFWVEYEPACVHLQGEPPKNEVFYHALWVYTEEELRVHNQT